MAKIPFKVSARTARLIGRENIASSKGAIIELVKNAYDADSPFCIVYFSTNNLYIIDAGEGMTQDIIANHWMTIGTNNKETDYFTKSGRVKAGAKGIGRFALDKLGSKCQMFTKFNSKVHTDFDDQGNKTSFEAYKWTVDWSDFEGEFKTIDKVQADLVGYKYLNLKEYIIKDIDNAQINTIIEDKELLHGTILHIFDLRDNWENSFIDQLYSDLEVLIPPKEHSSFKLYLISENEPDKYGEVLGSICDDYDYKLVAKADENQNVSIKIYRNEYDVETIDPRLFNREKMTIFPYRKEDFKIGYWETIRTFSELVKGFSDVDKENALQKIGVFEFTFYYMKRTYASDDLTKFYYRKFNAKERQDWLNKFGGIKLFRDEFRVRPYGEIKDSAFDWLGLGARKAKNPAPTSHPSGKWKAEPDNVAGAIGITRLGNIDFQDKSSREGLQESNTFQVFKNMILNILDVFEEDRATIAREMKLFHDDINFGQAQREYAEKLAKEILENARRVKEDINRNQKDNKSQGFQYEPDSDKILLAEFIKEKEEEIESLKDEQKLLRGMASSGIVIASFSHDLSKLSQNLKSRVDKLKNLISTRIKENDYQGVDDRKNPFYFLDRMKKQDDKLQNWLHFSLGVARKDKRKRKQLNFKSYFKTFQSDWLSVLNERAISLNINSADVMIRVFEIDIDSIFNNLLVNSIDAFNLSTLDRSREIIITVANTDKAITIEYTDNGPGLSKDITDQSKIFEPMFTTKVNQYTGDEEGTGLGMWLVKSIVYDNDGSLQLLYPKDGGFGIRIMFPRKYVRN